MGETVTTNRQDFIDNIADLVRRNQTRKERRKKIGAVARFLVVAAAVWVLRAWMFMLAIDAIHRYWLPGVPTLGFWWAGLICWLLRGALSLTAAPTKGGAK